MVQINEVEPARFRVGDLITIRGFGFSPGFGDNEVAIGGIPEPLQSETATELKLFVPPGIPENEYVSVFVFRSDTLDNDSTQAWSKEDLDALRSGASRINGQIPGVTEAADPVRVEDVPQAQDYERLTTRMEHLLYDVLGAVGDLFGFDGAILSPTPLGAAGQSLRANPAPATGMDFAPIPRATSLQWGGRRLAANLNTEALTPNSATNETNPIFGDHISPLTGTVREFVVLFAEGTAGDTLDQVVLEINGAPLHDTGVGLGITPGNSYIATLALAVTVADDVQVQVKKLGVNGDGHFTAQVEFR